jgi:hypothetical protein
MPERAPPSVTISPSAGTSPLAQVAATSQLRKSPVPTGSCRVITLKAADAAGVAVPPLNGRARLAAWLQKLDMGQFFAGFITAGFDDINFVAA